MKKILTKHAGIRTALVIVCSIVTSQTETMANLLINGSFEQGPGGYSVLNPGSTAITGWVVTRGQIDYEPGFQAADGVVCLDLNGSPGIGGVEQTFTTVSNQQYSVTFAMAGNPSTQQLYTMGVQAAGQSTSFTFDSTGHSNGSMGWAYMNWVFTANAASATLEFFSLTTVTPFDGPTLDNVSAVAVPEPSAGSLVLASLVAFALAKLKRGSK